MGMYRDQRQFSNCLTGSCHQMCVRVLIMFLVATEFYCAFIVYFYFVCIISICVFFSDVVLEAKPWPRGASRQNFMALALASGPVALASKIQALALRAVLTIFGITLKLK